MEDLRALTKLTESDLPTLCVVRPTVAVQVFYRFADASDRDFGSTLSSNYNCMARLSRSLLHQRD